MNDPTIQILAETERFSVWRSDDPDGEATYHLELGDVTVHLFREEFGELLELLGQVEDHAGGR